MTDLIYQKQLFNLLYQLEQHKSRGQINNQQKNIRFTHAVNLKHNIIDHTCQSERAELIISTHYYGILAQMGILPNHYIERIIEASSHGNTVLVEFFNIFLPKILSLHFQAWKKNKLHLKTKKYATKDRHKIISQAILGAPSYKQSANRASSIDSYARLFLSRCKTKKNLEKLLSHITQSNVDVIENCGKWQEIPTNMRTHIGTNRLNLNNRLGLETCIGGSVWDCQSHIIILIKPECDQYYLSLINSPLKESTLYRMINAFLPRQINYQIRFLFI